MIVSFMLLAKLNFKFPMFMKTGVLLITYLLTPMIKFLMSSLLKASATIRTARHNWCRSDDRTHLLSWESDAGTYDRSERRGTQSGAPCHRSCFQTQFGYFFTAAQRSLYFYLDKEKTLMRGYN